MMGEENYAVVDEKGNILSVVIWDGESQWSPPDGCIAVRCGDQICSIGGKYRDGEFFSPPQPEVSHEDLVSQATQQKTNLMAEASQQVSVLQDAVDLDMATDEENEMLLVWKRYRVLLNRVDPNLAPNIDWPNHP